MTKVDERSVVPPLDAAARARLAAALDLPGVVSALLFGSQATGGAGPLSDVDVAVWLDPELRPADHYDWQLKLLGRASEALGTGEVQVVILNQAPPLLRHRAIRDGVRLVERDPRARVRLETSAVLDEVLRGYRAAASTGRADLHRCRRPHPQRDQRHATERLCRDLWRPGRCRPARSPARGAARRRRQAAQPADRPLPRDRRPQGVRVARAPRRPARVRRRGAAAARR